MKIDLHCLKAAWKCPETKVQCQFFSKGRIVEFLFLTDINMKTKSSTRRMVFFTYTCQLCDFKLDSFSSPDYGEVPIECDWNRKIFQISTKIVVEEKLGLFLNRKKLANLL